MSESLPPLPSVPTVLPAPAVDWTDLMPPVILRYSVNLLAGAPGTGKTAFLSWWVKQVGERQPIFTLAPIVGDLYQAFIGADRSWDHSTRKWFDLQGATFDAVYSMQDDRQFAKERLRKKQNRITLFKECLYKVSPEGDGVFPANSIIYVDPLALFLGGNLNDYDACLVACSELRELCIAHGVTIIGTAHAAKQKADKSERYLRLQDRILGSAALFGYTDTQLYLASPEETGEKTYTFLWSPHHAKSQMFALERTDTGLFVPAGVQPGAGATPQFPTDVEWLPELITEQPRPLHQLIAAARDAEMSRATLVRRLKDLQALGHVSQPKHGLYQWVRPS